MAWGANVKKLDVGIPDHSFVVAASNQLARADGGGDGCGPGHPAALFFQKNRIGRPARLADDTRRRCRSHPAQDDLGRRVSVAGVVAIVAGLMWGARAACSSACR